MTTNVGKHNYIYPIACILLLPIKAHPVCDDIINDIYMTKIYELFLLVSRIITFRFRIDELFLVILVSLHCSIVCSKIAN